MLVFMAHLSTSLSVLLEMLHVLVFYMFAAPV
mgnify:CR=1 FL=1